MSLIRSLASGFTDLRAHAAERAQFLQDLSAALEDGRLSGEEMAQLEKERDAFGLTEEDIRGVRLQLYLKAFEAVSADARVTEEEWTEMEKIQTFLGIEDREIGRTKQELLRLHILHEVKRGNLPVVSVKRLALQKGEIAHWEETAELTEKGERPVRGVLIITSKRLIFRSAKEAISLRLTSILDLQKLHEGVRITENGKDPKELRTFRPAYVGIIQAILARAMERHGEY
jgi:hypothetical protein